MVCVDIDYYDLVYLLENRFDYDSRSASALVEYIVERYDDVELSLDDFLVNSCIEIEYDVDPVDYLNDNLSDDVLEDIKNERDDYENYYFISANGVVIFELY